MATSLELAETNKRIQQSQTQTRTHQLLTAATDKAEPDEYFLYHTEGPSTTPLILLTLQVNGQDLTMELYTGATLSFISEELTNLYLLMQHL